MVIDDIQAIVSERGSKISQADIDEITMMAVDVPLEDSDQIGAIFEAIALVVNDPLYEGDADPID